MNGTSRYRCDGPDRTAAHRLQLLAQFRFLHPAHQPHRCVHHPLVGEPQRLRRHDLVQAGPHHLIRRRQQLFRLGRESVSHGDNQLAGVSGLLCRRDQPRSLDLPVAFARNCRSFHPNRAATSMPCAATATTRVATQSPSFMAPGFGISTTRSAHRLRAGPPRPVPPAQTTPLPPRRALSGPALDCCPHSTADAPPYPSPASGSSRPRSPPPPQPSPTQTASPPENCPQYEPPTPPNPTADGVALPITPAPTSSSIPTSARHSSSSAPTTPVIPPPNHTKPRETGDTDPAANGHAQQAPTDPRAMRSEPEGGPGGEALLAGGVGARAPQNTWSAQAKRR